MEAVESIASFHLAGRILWFCKRFHVVFKFHEVVICKYNFAISNYRFSPPEELCK